MADVLEDPSTDVHVSQFHDPVEADEPDVAPGQAVEPVCAAVADALFSVADAVPLSKNAAKKLARQAEWAEKSAAKKAAKKAADREKSEAKHVVLKQRLAEMSSEELAAHAARRAAKFVERQEQKAVVEAKKAASQTSPFHFVVDLSFCDLMEPKELKSMAFQLTSCYAHNSRSEKPCRLTFSSLSGELAAELARQTGVERWPVERSEAHYLALFGGDEEAKKRMVYLTADSLDVLEDIKEGEIYIIGGIVDRNRHKGLTQGAAAAAGVRTARLPLSSHVVLSGSAVLTVNQVVHLLVAQLGLRDWRAACEAAVPQRKRANADGAMPMGRKVRRAAAAGGAGAAGGGGAGAHPGAAGRNALDGGEKEGEEEASDELAVHE